MMPTAGWRQRACLRKKTRGRNGSENKKASSSSSTAEPRRSYWKAVPRPQPQQQPPAPTPRPTMSSTAWNYLIKRQDLDALELPETADSPAQRAAVQFPFPGGEPEPEPEDEFEGEPEFEDEDGGDVEAEVVPAEPVAV